MSALRQHLEALQPWELDAITLDRWNDVSGLASRFGTTDADVTETLNSLRKAIASPRWQFTWLSALNQAQGRGLISLKGLKVGVALFSCANPSRPYVWPSQQTIADLAGWSRGNRRGIFDGLRELVEEIGAVRRLRFIDLPVAVLADAEVAMGAAKDPRSAAYCLIPSEQWKADQSPLGKHKSVSPGEALNSNDQHQRAAHGFASLSFGDKQSVSPQVERLNQGTDGGVSYG